MAQADAIVLGVPNYYDVPNALTHAMLERCFCFRHQGTFSLKDKPIVILSTGYSKDEENSQVLNIVEHFANKNKMKPELFISFLYKCGAPHSITIIAI